MLSGVFGVSVWSEDHSRLVPFYRDVLNLPVLLETDGFAVFGQQDGVSLLVGTHSEVRGRNGDAARHIVSLHSDDTQADFARLKAAGVTIVAEPSMQGPNFLMATFADPEGNLFSVVQPMG
jgi:predicted enzyme related to lactoylglutathione lyase